jgi:hypothetical protein
MPPVELFDVGSSPQPTKAIVLTATANAVTQRFHPPRLFCASLFM